MYVFYHKVSVIALLPLLLPLSELLRDGTLFVTPLQSVTPLLKQGEQPVMSHHWAFLYALLPCYPSTTET